MFDDDDEEQLEEKYVVEHNNCNRDEASNPFLRRANATGREGGEAPESERVCDLENYVSSDPYLPFSIDADRTYIVEVRHLLDTSLLSPSIQPCQPPLPCKASRVEF